MISFVVLHYLVDDETISTVNSILKNVQEARVIIVDNASPNNSFEILCDYYQNNDKVTIIKNDRNAGYASGINLGYHHAKNLGNSDFIVAMNNDMEILQEDFYQRVQEIYGRTGFYVFGPDIYSTSAQKHQNPEKVSLRTLESVNKEIDKINYLQQQTKSLRLKSLLKNIPLVKPLYYGLKKQLKKEVFIEEEQVDAMLHGSFYIFSPDFMKVRDYALYPKTTFYCEAQILDYECHRDQLKRIYSPKIKVLHHEDVATDAVNENFEQKMKKKYQFLLESLAILKTMIEEDLRNTTK